MDRTDRVALIHRPMTRTAIPLRFGTHRTRVLAILTRWEQSFRRQCA